MKKKIKRYLQTKGFFINMISKILFKIQLIKIKSLNKIF